MLLVSLGAIIMPHVQVVAVVAEGQKARQLREGGMGEGCDHQLDRWKNDSNSNGMPEAYVALHRVPPLTQEIPLPGGSTTRIRLNIMDLIEVGLQLLVSELIQ